MSTTVTEQEKRFCRYQGIMCEYATEYGYCKTTACAKRHEYVQNLKFGNALHGAYKGGDAEMDNCQAQAPQNYMQQSRHNDGRMTREEAKQWLEAMKSAYALPIETYEALDMAIEALSADAILAKIQIDDIDKAKTSSQLLDDLAVDMVNAMGKRIVEVVRCKECRHRDLFSCPLADNDFQKDDDYCSWGERREP